MLVGILADRHSGKALRRSWPEAWDLNRDVDRTVLGSFLKCRFHAGLRAHVA
jgi:hypothetical protein